MGDWTNGVVSGVIRFIGLCIILPIAAGFLGFALIPVVATIYKWFGGQIPDESLGIVLVFFLPPICAGAAFLFGLFRLATASSNW